MKLLRSLSVVCLSAMTLNTAHAGSVTFVTDEPDEGKALCNYRYEGVVEDGDAKKLEDISNFGSVPARICFDSPGGSMSEGLKMFDVLWDRQFQTVVPKDARCESACALAWLAGSARLGTGAFRAPMRHVEVGGNLGFHAPSLELGGDRNYPAEVVEQSFSLALGVAQGLYRLRLHQEDGAHAMAKFLYHQTLATPPEDMFYIDTIGKAVLADVAIGGLPLPDDEDLGPQEMLNVCNAAWLSYSELPPDFTNVQDLYTDLAATEQRFNGQVFSVEERVRMKRGEYSVGALVRGYPRISHNSETICKATTGSGSFYVSFYPMYDGDWSGFEPDGSPVAELTIPQIAVFDPSLALTAVRSLPSRASNQNVNERFLSAKNYDRPGHDIAGADVQGVSFDECKQICQSNPRCKAFAYVKSRQWCWPKDWVAQRRSLDGVDSGYFPER